MTSGPSSLGEVSRGASVADTASLVVASGSQHLYFVLLLLMELVFVLLI